MGGEELLTAHCEVLKGGRGVRKKKHYSRLRLDSGHHKRIVWVALVLGLGALIPVALQLTRLMIVDYEYYADQALRNQSRTTPVAGVRGVIYDRNMNILATSESVDRVYLAPQELKQSRADLEALSRFLGQTLNLDPEWILTQAKDIKMRYKQIAAAVEKETAAAIRAYIVEKDIRGIHLEPSWRRVYPYGPLAAQVVGFTNASGNGSEGIEASWNRFLEGQTGKVITTKGSNEMDMPFSLERFLTGQEGRSLVLTLDCTVQACLENRMQQAMDQYAVQNGAFGLVMEVKTGKILAMATLGSYDPNNYLEITDEKTLAQLQLQQLQYEQHPVGSSAYTQGKEAYQSALNAARLKQWRNRCISDGYEPGSTFKILTMAAALDCGAINLDTPFYCKGAEQIPGRAQLLHCWRSAGHGSQKTPQALQNSCNLAFAHIALKLGGERFYEYVEKFGVLEKTGIDLIGESKGVFFSKELVTNTDKWGTASLTSGSFGQTFKLTPLQLCRAIASVVNGGNLMKPYIVSEVLDEEGNTVQENAPALIRQTIRPETSKVMCSLLQSVVTEGTAKNAAVAGFSIGGKTGTSEKIDVFDANGQRVTDKIVSFVGIAPMDDPEVLVLVALDSPSKSTGIYISGGVMAAPTVGAVLSDILPYLQIPREEVPMWTVADLTGMTVSEAEKLLKEGGLTPVYEGTGTHIRAQIPAPGQNAPTGSQILLYLEE